MKRQLILNADDYGMTEGIVDGIVQCAQAQVITSTTVMTTGKAFAYGLTQLNALKNISIGVHLDCSTGKPVSPISEIPSLLTSSGNFSGIQNPEQVALIQPMELKIEFRRQIQRALDHGILVSHLDIHHHWIYLSPKHFHVVAELAQEYNLPVRFPFGAFSAERVSLFSRNLRISEDRFQKIVQECGSILNEFKIPKTDYFWIEFTSLHCSYPFLQNLVTHLPPGISEICLHPGLGTERLQKELEILLKAGAEGLFTNADSIELVTYEVLKKCE